MTTTPHPTLSDARSLVAAGDKLYEEALASAKEITENGRAIDDHQVLTERIAYAATEIRAAREVLDYADGVVAEGRSSEPLERLWATASAELVANLRDRLEPSLDELGIVGDCILASLGVGLDE